MRHLRRLYFDNAPAAGAKEKWVSIVDQGVDGGGNARYAVRVGSMSMPVTFPEVTEAINYLQLTPCFFKLPIGSSAIVDIYVPDAPGSAEAKTFDYQVFKAKNPTIDAAQRSASQSALAEMMMAMPAAKQSQASAAGPAGPGGGGGPGDGGTGGGGTGGGGPSSICCVDEPCGNLMEIPCDDPLGTVAVCQNGNLVCAAFAPPPPVEKEN